MDGRYEVTRDHKTELEIWPMRHNVCSPHFHSSIELTYVLSGEFKTVVSGHTYVVQPDTLVIFSSYCTHANLQEKRAKTIVMTIPSGLVGAASSRMSGKIFRDVLVTDPDVCSEVLHCMKRLIRYKADGMLDTCIAKGYAYVIIGLLINKVGLVDVSSNKTDFFFKDILAYIEENYTSPLSLAMLSSKFGYSKYSFSHLFNSYFSCTLTDYINALRARCAANMLVTEDLSMTEIAMQSGFESLRTFYRVFKETYHCTPSAYKKKKLSDADP